MIQSPCTKVCEIDPRTGLCRGCGRSMPEITSWARLTPAARHAVMRQLPARLTAARDTTLEGGD